MEKNNVHSPQSQQLSQSQLQLQSQPQSQQQLSQQPQGMHSYAHLEDQVNRAREDASALRFQLIELQVGGYMQEYKVFKRMRVVGANEICKSAVDVRTTNQCFLYSNIPHYLIIITSSLSYHHHCSIIPTGEKNSRRGSSEDRHRDHSSLTG